MDNGHNYRAYGAVGIEAIQREAIIKNVAASHSSRLFTPEKKDDPAMTAFVFLVIRSNISLALYKAGVPVRDITTIDPTEEIISIMVKDGYVWEEQGTKGGQDA